MIRPKANSEFKYIKMHKGKGESEMIIWFILGVIFVLGISIGITKNIRTPQSKKDYNRTIKDLYRKQK